MIERYGRLIGGFFAGAALLYLIIGITSGNWNPFSKGNGGPQEGDACSTPTVPSGTIKNGVCTS